MRSLQHGRTGPFGLATASRGRHWFARVLVSGWLIVHGLAADLGTARSQASEPVRFNRDIRPILSDNCYFCHGPDQNKRKAGLRLDTRNGLFGSLEGTVPVVPGDLAASEVYARITTDDPDDLMPAPKSGKRLTAAQKALIKRWIEQGAPWEGHWAYTPAVRPSLPPVNAAAWPQTPVDHFILARLESEGLAPSPEADARTLLRRLSFDLRGLPPSSEELATFTRELTQRGYEQMVGRFLASPHFGERLALYWLDLVRYADTDGYHGDNYRSVWPYRDYVIQSFNANQPFDQFTIEQLAGDLLPEASRAQIIASTYNRLGRTTEEGGAQAKEYLAKYAADRVRTTATVWMGATMACAECHDHKFDPYTQRDFYRFAAFFADVKEQGVSKPDAVQVPTTKQQAERKRLDQQIAALARQLETPSPELAAGQARWEARLQADLAANRLGWTVLNPSKLSSINGATLEVQEDDSVLISGKNPDNDVYVITLQTDREHLTGLRLEALTHPSLANGRLSRANGNFVLTEVDVEAAPGAGAQGAKVPIASALADFSQPDYPVAAAIDGKPDTGWAVDGHHQATNRQAVFVFAEPVVGGAGTTLTVRLKHESQFKHHNLGRFRLAVISLDQPGLGADGLPEAITTIVHTPSEQRSPDQAAALARHYRGLAPELKSVRAALAATRKAKEELETSVPTTLATVAVEPRPMRVLARGNWQDDSGEIVTPAVPAFLGAAENTERRALRLDLAEWLVVRDNPLTARVFVNRLWKLFFGTGIARNLDDFGAQGEGPVHPELLDWLAVEFVESGWDVKQIVRLLVTSRAYRQSSLTRPELREQDPQNRLLARQSRFRLEAEMVRDNALAISGLLVDTVGGPSVKPYQPEGYWDQLNFPKRKWVPDHGDALYRRGLYTFWCRTFLQPSLAAFDAPGREECTAERGTSNTPQQALALLNDPGYVEAARALAERIMRQGGSTPETRMHWTFLRALNRPPRERETQLLREHYQKERARFAVNMEAARQLITTGESVVAADVPAIELAAWTSVARVVLNLHETITRY